MPVCLAQPRHAQGVHGSAHAIVKKVLLPIALPASAPSLASSVCGIAFAHRPVSRDAHRCYTSVRTVHQVSSAGHDARHVATWQGYAEFGVLSKMLMGMDFYFGWQHLSAISNST